LSVKIQPEFVHAANPDYEGFPLNIERVNLEVLRWYMYYKYYLNNIDSPERFGDNAYNKVYWGQSSIRLTFNAISFGFSTENLWWGPGMRNSLIMTNTASGFNHFTLNTVKPINTIIGSFEGQIIAGWLKSSGYFPPDHLRDPYMGLLPFFIPKPDDDRYLNGMILSYQPKWVPGLFIGLIRSIQAYQDDLKGGKLFDYLPIFSSFSEKAAGGGEEINNKKQDPYYSIFFRYVWPESHVEIYGEIGRSDYYWNLRDLIVQTEHSSAYNLGFRKLVPINNIKKDYLQVNLELTQLGKNPTTTLREDDSWGLSSIVRDGYTHNGQFLGPGIGPASNSQTLNISWLRSFKMIGLQIERLSHNEDYFYTAFSTHYARWVDFKYSLIGNWNYRNLLFMIELKAIVAKNYQWDWANPGTSEYPWNVWENTYNFHGQFSVIYRF
jgi:hypothetical protein